MCIRDSLSGETLTDLSENLRQLQEPSDRPFASFQYVGRAKHRLHYLGQWRMSSYFKIGTVGGALGERIQQIIHQDIWTQSVRVLNWERQIGSGGRLGFNIEHEFDLLLYSKFQNVFKPRQKTFDEDRMRWNVYLPTEVAIGNVNTHWGLGIGVSNRSFLQTNKHYEVKYKREETYCKPFKNIFDKGEMKCRIKRVWEHTYLGFEYRARRVIHNSMLHGLGYFKRFEDDPFDNESSSVYFLDKESTAKWFHRVNLTLSFRLRKATFFYSCLLYTSPSPRDATLSRMPSSA